MAESKMVGVRLNTVEQVMLAKCQKSNSRGDLNASEFFRLLLRREYGRRFGDSDDAKPKEFSTDFRQGRPKDQPELNIAADLGPLFKKGKKKK